MNTRKRRGTTGVGEPIVAVLAIFLILADGLAYVSISGSGGSLSALSSSSTTSGSSTTGTGTSGSSTGPGSTTTSSTGTGGSTSTGSTGSTGSGSSGSVTITIPQGVGNNQALNFSPVTLTVAPGTTITFVDQDSTATHNVDFTSGPSGASLPPTSPNLKNGQTYQVSLTAAGTYDYHCDYHAWMTASITVS